MGRLALSGLNPSSQQPRGGPAPADPLADKYGQCVACLSDLVRAMQRFGRQRRAIDIQEIMVKLQRMQTEDQDRMLKASVEGAGSSAYNANFPNVNGGGVV